MSLLLVPLSCVAPTKMGSTFDAWRPVTANDWNESLADEYGGTGALILYSGYIIQDQELREEWIPIEHYLRVRVLDERGVADFGTVEIPYASGIEIKEIQARTINRDGTMVDVAPEDIRDKLILSFGKRAVQAKAFAFKNVDPGDIVEYRYTMNVNSFCAPPIWLQEDHYILESSVKWWFKKIPYNPRLGSEYYFSASYVVTNPRGLDLTVEEVPEHAPEMFDFHLSRVPPCPEEPFMPHKQVGMSLLIPQYVPSDPDLYHEYWIKAAEGLGDITREFVGRGRGLDSWMEAILAEERDFHRDLDLCFRKIHEEIRCYEYLMEGERMELGDLRNENLAELLRRGLGTTQEVNGLLVAMLRKLGYDATVCYLRDRNEGVFVKEWQSCHQFTMTGVLAKHEREHLWCFPGYPMATPECVPWEATGCVALLADTYSGENPFPPMSKVPLPDSRGNVIELRFNLALDPYARAVGILDANCRFQNDMELVHQLGRLGEEERFARIRERLLPASLSWNATGETMVQDGARISYSCTLSVEGLLEEAGQDLLLHFFHIRPDDISLPAGRRVRPIHFHYPMQYLCEVDLELPPGYGPSEMPGGVHWESGPFRFVCRPDQRGGGLHVSRKLTIEECFFETESASALREFFHEVYARYEDPILLVAAEGTR